MVTEESVLGDIDDYRVNLVMQCLILLADAYTCMLDPQVYKFHQTESSHNKFRICDHGHLFFLFLIIILSASRRCVHTLCPQVSTISCTC